MSLDASRWAWAQRDIPATAKLVLLALAECVYGKGDGVTCWPSVTHLTELTALSRRAVFNALDVLEEAGRVTRGRGRRGKATLYRLGFDGCTSCTSAPDALVQEVHGIVQEVHGGSAPDAPGSAPGAHQPGKNQEENQEGTRTTMCARESHRRKKSMQGGSVIPSDWTPSARVTTWAGKQGMSADWVAEQIDEFVVYWTDRGDSRKSWDATFMNRLRILQAQRPTGTSDATRQPLAAKDYRKGATPLEDIPWLNAASVG